MPGRRPRGRAGRRRGARRGGADRRWRLGGKVGSGAPAAHGAAIQRFDVHSRYVHDTLGQVAAAPAGGGAGRPLLVFLHGRGGRGPESDSNADFYAALGQARRPGAERLCPPTAATTPTTTAACSGDWNRYMLDEVIPEAVAPPARRPEAHRDRRHLDGRLGALPAGAAAAADVLRGRRPLGGVVAARAARPRRVRRRRRRTSPATTHRPARGARARAVGARAALARRRHRRPVPCRRAMRSPPRCTSRCTTPPGGHNGDYWRAHYARYLRFYATALARC